MASLTLCLHEEDAAKFSAEVLCFHDGRSWIEVDLGGGISFSLPATDAVCLAATRRLIDILTTAAADLEAKMAERWLIGRDPDCTAPSSGR